MFTLTIHNVQGNPSLDFTKLNARVYIIPILPTGHPIPLHRLSPLHSNIRVSISTDSDKEKGTNPATPFYNTSLLTCLLPRPSLLATHALKESTPAFADALTLLRVWANQRGYSGYSNSAPDSPGTMHVHGFESIGAWWSVLLDLLISGEESGKQKTTKGQNAKGLGRGLSSYQLFRAALDFLGRRNLRKEGVFVKRKDGSGHRVRPQCFPFLILTLREY